jgi:hypothetical protein
MAADRAAPARSHQRRGHRRGGTGSARPTGRGELAEGVVIDGQGRSTAGGKERRRPRRRAGVPGEGPVNTGNQGAQEHQGEVRVRFPNLIWPRKRWKWVVDGEVVLGRFRRGAAWGWSNSGEGGPGAGPD